MPKLRNNDYNNGDIFDSTAMYSPLGEVEDKFRYIVILTPKKNSIFENTTIQSLKDIINTYLYENGAILEEVVFLPDYALLTILISINTAIDKVIMHVLRKNKKLFRQHYFMTNTEFPNEHTINEYLAVAKEFDSIKPSQSS